MKQEIRVVGSNLTSGLKKLWGGHWSIYYLTASNSPFITCSEKIKKGLCLFLLLLTGTILSFVSGVPWRDIIGWRTSASWFWGALAANCCRHTWLLQPPAPATQAPSSATGSCCTCWYSHQHLLLASPCSSFVSESFQWEASPRTDFLSILEGEFPASSTSRAPLWLLCHPRSHGQPFPLQQSLE